jgi:hypothetical protein
MDAFEHFQIATGLIQEGSRPAAAVHLRAAIRAEKRRARPDRELCDELQRLLDAVTRNMREAA